MRRQQNIYKTQHNTDRSHDVQFYDSIIGGPDNDNGHESIYSKRIIFSSVQSNHSHEVLLSI